MGLFDIFKKKPEPPSNKRMSLEVLLRKAALLNSHRDEFYQRLLSDDLVVIADRSGLANGKQLVDPGTEIALVALTDGRIPVFTSSERVFDNGVVKTQVECLKLKGSDLLAMVKGSKVVLNPFSEFRKELLPDEIERLLNGTDPVDVIQDITFQKPTLVEISQPSVYPTEIVNALTALFARYPNVKAGYLGLIYIPNAGQQAHYVIGLDADGDIGPVAQEAGPTIKQFLGKYDVVDFMHVEDDSGLGSYFLDSVDPFYER
ncbi:MAG: enhanced serine sensitivity protein SseB C-terminal domain-containing protein [Ignavibacteria bacterium]|nr:enhanced serine sensitivity protein SseB C-terminal domain-containing protein [Ignavibacteria bacterium]